MFGRALAATLTVSLGAAFAATVLVLPGIPWGRSGTLALVLILLPGIPLFGLFLSSGSVLIGKGHNEARAALDLISSILLLVATVLVVDSHLRSRGYALAYVGYLGVRSRGRRRRNVVRSTQIPRHSAGARDDLAGFNAARSVRPLRHRLRPRDSVMLFLIRGDQAVALYGVAYQIANFLFAMPALLSNALLPEFMSADDERRRFLARRALDVILTVALPLPLFGAIFARPFVVWIVGPDFRGAGTPLANLTGAAAIALVNGYLFQMAIFAGAERGLWRVIGTVTVAESCRQRGGGHLLGRDRRCERDDPERGDRTSDVLEDLSNQDAKPARSAIPAFCPRSFGDASCDLVGAARRARNQSWYRRLHVPEGDCTCRLLRRRALAHYPGCPAGIVAPAKGPGLVVTTESSKSSPLVSIGLPVFNGMPYLPDALASLLDQDEPNIEIILSDNASQDATEEYCRAVASRRFQGPLCSPRGQPWCCRELSVCALGEHGPLLRLGGTRRRLLPELRFHLSECLEGPPGVRAVRPCASQDRRDGHGYLDPRRATRFGVHRPGDSPSGASLEARLADNLRTVAQGDLRRIWTPLPIWGSDVVLVWRALLVAPVETVAEPLGDYRVFRSKTADATLSGLTAAESRAHLPNTRMVRELKQASEGLGLSAEDRKTAARVLRRWMMTRSYRELAFSDLWLESRRFWSEGGAMSEHWP